MEKSISAWDACQNPRWMLWSVGQSADKSAARKLVACACDFARLTPLCTDDPRASDCIRTVVRFYLAEVGIEEVEAARDSAEAARFALCTEPAARPAYFAASAAVDVAETAIVVSKAVRALSWGDVLTARQAFVDATFATAHASSVAAATGTAESVCADIVRRHFPGPFALVEVP